MRPPKNNSRLLRKSALAAAGFGLGLGTLLGYSLKSAPPSAPVPAATAGPQAVSSGPPGAGESKKLPPPYDLEPVLKSGFAPLAVFEAWLRTAPCDAVTRVLLDPAVNLNSYPGNPPLNLLLLHRFREFSTDERFTCLQRHLRDGSMIQNFDLLPVFSDLAKDTLPRRAEEMLALFKKGSQFDDFNIAPALKDWAAADFPAALEFAGKLQGYGRERVMGMLIGGLAERDLSLAQQQALKLPAGQSRLEAVRAIGSVMAKSDLGAALDWINQSGGGERGSFYSNPASRAISAAVAANPAAAAQLLLDRPGFFEGGDGPDMVNALFTQWAAKDPAGAAAWMETHSLSETHQKTAGAALAEMRIRQLPLEEALKGWASLPMEVRRGSLDVLVTERLVSEDREHAVERLAAMVPGKERGEVIVGLFDKLRRSQSGPPGQEQFAQALPYLAEMGAYLQENPDAASSFRRLSPEQLEQAEKLMPPKAAAALRNAVLENMLDNDPGRALSMTADDGPETLDPYNASRLAVSMAAGDPAKASAWVAGFPEGGNKEWAALNLVANWAKYDPAAATAWVEALPPGRSRDRAAIEAAKIQGLTGGGSESTLRLAAGIQDAKDRSEATGYALQSLWRKDPAAAATALAETGLPAADQAALTTKLGQGGFSR